MNSIIEEVGIQNIMKNKFLEDILYMKSISEKQNVRHYNPS